MGVTESPGSRDQVADSTTTGKEDMATIIDSRIKSINQSSLTAADIWYWPTDHGAPKSDIDRKPTKILTLSIKAKKF